MDMKLMELRAHLRAAGETLAPEYVPFNYLPCGLSDPQGENDYPDNANVRRGRKTSKNIHPQTSIIAPCILRLYSDLYDTGETSRRKLCSRQ